MEDINRRWREASCRPSHQSPTITDTGLMLGYETRLVRRPNGGLFLAATDDTFKTENPAHLAAARAIEAALQPLNAIPYPIDDPYR